MKTRPSTRAGQTAPPVETRRAVLRADGAAPPLDQLEPRGARRSGTLARPATEAAPADLDSIAAGRHGDPHSVLGPHAVVRDGVPSIAVRALLPGVDEAWIAVRDKPEEPSKRIAMKRIHPDGIFEAVVPGKKKLDYRLEVLDTDGSPVRMEDPYRFPASISPLDRWLFNEGTLKDVASLLGSHEREIDGVKGFNFVVWAPNAKRVSVVGDHNGWDGRRHPMRKLDDSGLWEIFLPGVADGQKYQLELLDPKGVVKRRSDPAARRTEIRPGTASITLGRSSYGWNDAAWLAARAKTNLLEQPVSTYEVHLPSWQRGADGGFLGYEELADRLVPYLKEKGFTHVELFGLLEHPLDDSWGYQVTGYFAPTARHGKPDGFKVLVDRLHQAGIGVLVDWVPAHFPKDESGLAGFDGTNLFDHADPRQGEHKDWGTRIFNYGRNEVRAFLEGGLTHLLEEYHLDGVRVDAVASMLYLDYSRKAGEWIPNAKGGNENLEAIEFIKRTNTRVGASFPGVMRVAEESTAWPGVTSAEGLGFDLKWNMGWMNDTLRWFKTPTEHRGKDLDLLTNTFLWAASEKYVCSLSHDEVVHGKKSLLEKMPGDDWQKFANLRLLYGYMWSYPGHKLLAMGSEIAQRKEWAFDKALDWKALEDPAHQGVSRLVTDLNGLYKSKPALYERQFEPEGMQLVFRDAENAAVGILRRGKKPADDLLFVHNLTEKVREEYRIGVDAPGKYREVLNTDAAIYGGSNVGNLGEVTAEAVPFHDKPYSIRVTLPPLATVAFERSRKPRKKAES